MVTADIKLKDSCSLEEKLWQIWKLIKKQRHYSLLTKVCLVKANVFPVVMYGCESWTIKKAENRIIDALELWYWRRLFSLLDCKEIKPVSPKGNHTWIFIGRTDAEVEAPILWPPDAKNWLIGKDHDAGKDWRQEEKGIQRLGGWMASPSRWTWVWASSQVTDREACVCYSPLGGKELGMGEQLNWTIILFSSLVGEQIVFPLP